jgi:hypothetical protein
MECWKRWGWRRFRSKYLKAVANIWAKTDGTSVIVDMSNNVGIEDFEQSPNSTLFAGTSVLTPYQLRTRLHL